MFYNKFNTHSLLKEQKFLKAKQIIKQQSKQTKDTIAYLQGLILQS